MSGTVKKIVKASAVSAAAFGGLSYTVFNEVINRNGKLFSKIGNLVTSKKDNSRDDNSPSALKRQWSAQQEFEEFTLLNNRNMKLKGYLLRAEKPSNVYAFCSHGYRSSGMGEYGAIMKFYHDLGYNVFFVDHQSAGKSDGVFIGFGYFEYKDCLQWLNFMLKNFGSDIEIILHGISMGSATVMLMSGDDKLPENVKFTVADCGYTSAWNQFEYNLKSYHVPVHPILDGADFWSRKLAGYGFKETDALASVKHAKVPMLFIHGTADDFVPTYMGRELYEACNAEYKDLLLVDGAWHARSYDKNPDAYEAKVKEFIEKFI